MIAKRRCVSIRAMKFPRVSNARGLRGHEAARAVERGGGEDLLLTSIEHEQDQAEREQDHTAFQRG